MIEKNSSAFEFIRQNVEVGRFWWLEDEYLFVLLDWSEEIWMEYSKNSRYY